MTPARFQLGLGLWLGLLGHAIAWALFGLLGIDDDSAAIPSWAVLALHFGGRHAVVAIFSLAATLWTYVGMIEHHDEGRPRVGRAIGLLGALVVAGYAALWFHTDHPVLGAFGVLAMLPGVLGPPAPQSPPPVR